MQFLDEWRDWTGEWAYDPGSNAPGKPGALKVKN
jgi:hypothetical protein